MSQEYSSEENGETFLWSAPKRSQFSIIYISDSNNHSISFGLDNVYESYKSMNIYGSNELLSSKKARYFIKV